ncbi:MAG: hypothetical protein PHD97_13035 [Bacteroidales bacterium]|nr:hypothetical protein [Bacteroidales bacterium]
MALLTKGKHIIGEIDGVRCTIVETGATEERIKFLKELLEFNKFEVKTLKETEKETYTIGVTDLIFNPIIAVYDSSLITPQGCVVRLPIWRQESTKCYPNYWRV